MKNLTALKAAAYKAGYLLKFTGEWHGDAKLYALFKGRIQQAPAVTVEQMNGVK